MKPHQVNLLILTITLALCTLTWGTIIVLRQTNDVNYHPKPNTAEQQRVETYKDCMSAPYTKDDGCSAIIEEKK